MVMLVVVMEIIVTFLMMLMTSKIQVQLERPSAQGEGT